jgi:hypothetical protein
MTEENSKMIEEYNIEKVKTVIKPKPNPYASPYRPKVYYEKQYKYDPEYDKFLLSYSNVDFRYDVRKSYKNLTPKEIGDYLSLIDWSQFNSIGDYNSLDDVDWSQFNSIGDYNPLDDVDWSQFIGDYNSLDDDDWSQFYSSHPDIRSIIYDVNKPSFECILNFSSIYFNNEKPVYNYDGLKKRMEKSGLKQQIISVALHPWRITRMCQKLGLGFNCLKEKLFYIMHRSGLKAELISVVFYHSLDEEILQLALHPDRLEWILKEYDINFSTLMNLLY